MRFPSRFPLNFRVDIVVVLAAVVVIVAGCSTTRPAPVEDRVALQPSAPVAAAPAVVAPVAPAAVAPVPTYTVKRGDTLHQIALDTGLDYRELAAWNNIENPNVIRVGQVLRLVAPGESAPQTIAQDAPAGVTVAPLRAAPPVVATAPTPTPPAVPTAPTTASSVPSATGPAGATKTSPKAIKEPYSDQAVRDLTLAASAVPAPPDTVALATPPAVRAEPKSDPKVTAATPTPAPSSSPAPATSGDSDALDWAWPAKGKIVAGFSETANLKGIDIAGTAGQAVTASAAGRVVYAGTGLRGYGKLIIIKHNSTFLSAYAHNREILVKEGQQVARGQKIAEMGNTDADQVKLHFEIRRQGKPMDPTKYLPPA